MLFAGHPERLGAVALDMRAIGQMHVGCSLQHLLQQLLALAQRCLTNVHPVHMQQVEYRQRQRHLAFAGQGGLQQVEVFLGAASGDQFAIDLRIAQAQRLDGIGNFRCLVGPLQCIARPQPHLAIGHRGQDAITVPFDFMQPLRAFGRGLHQLGQLRRKRGIFHLGATCAAQRQRLFRPGATFFRRWRRYGRQPLALGLAGARAAYIVGRCGSDVGQ